jgi:hypothetical protein
VLSTSEQNIVEVSFPAEHQLHTGVYSLIIVAKVYAPGYNKENLKTITADIPNVFELVDNLQAGIDTGITIKVTTMADAVRQMKLTESYQYHDEIVYEDGIVSISFYFETVSDSEWEEALSELSPEEIEGLKEGLIETYGLSLDDVHEMVRNGYFWSRTFTCQPWATLLMV